MSEPAPVEGQPAPEAPAPATEALPAESNPFINNSGEFQQDWVDRLDEDNRAHVSSLKDFKDINGLVKSYANAKKMVGGDRLPVIPGEESTPEEIQSFREAMGIPHKASGYGIERPKDVDEETFGAYMDAFHKSNASPALVSELMQMRSSEMEAATEAAQAAEDAAIQAEHSALQQEWGFDFDKNVDLARRGAMTLGIDVENSPLSNSAEFAKAMVNLAQLISEDKIVDGPAAGNPWGNPASEAEAIQRDNTHPDYAAYRDPNHTRHGAVVDKLRGLRKMAARS